MGQTRTKENGSQFWQFLSQHQGLVGTRGFIAHMSVQRTKPDWIKVVVFHRNRWKSEWNKGGYDSMPAKQTKTQTGSQFWLRFIAQMLYIFQKVESLKLICLGTKQSHSHKQKTIRRGGQPQLNNLTHSRSRTFYLWLLTPLCVELREFIYYFYWISSWSTSIISGSIHDPA